MKFELNEVEEKAWKEFDKLHQSTCSQYTGAIGQSPVQTIFTATSIGTDIVVKCSKCGIEQNITDMNCF
jgi:hypothetical protein